MDRNQRVNEIISFLSVEEREQFLSDLLSAVDEARNIESFDPINECVDGWEDIAELNSIPGLKDRVWARYNRLKDSGRVN